MVSYQKERCGLHPGKKSPSIWLDHGRSKSMVDKLNLMHWLALIRLWIQSNWSALITRQPNTYVTSSHKVGFVDILVLSNVYMTKEVNSSDRIFNGYWKSLASRMYARPAKNPQSNAICERMHQTVTNVLRTLVHTNPLQKWLKLET